VLVRRDDELYVATEEKNLLRQYDYVQSSIEIGIKQGPHSFDRSFILALHHLAMANLSHFCARYRNESSTIDGRVCPHYKDIPELVDEFVEIVQERWFTLTPLQLAAYGLWRPVWIHPFADGNGRTARAISYFLLCARGGRLFNDKADTVRAYPRRASGILRGASDRP
jgi:Fic family protein